MKKLIILFLLLLSLTSFSQNSNEFDTIPILLVVADTTTFYAKGFVNTNDAVILESEIPYRSKEIFYVLGYSVEKNAYDKNIFDMLKPPIYLNEDKQLLDSNYVIILTKRLWKE